MDLKLKDVAELLNVSETTIRRWLKDGKIPAYQINHQYRFDRGEIEDWMMRCKLKMDEPFMEEQIYPPPKEGMQGGLQQFSLYRAMNKGGVFHDIKGRNKKEVIKKVAYLAAPRLSLDPDVIAELLLDREAMMPTAMDHGIAIPHPRDSVLKVAGSDVVITAFPEKPLEYGALDGQSVHTLFFLFSSSDKTHLHLLSKLAHLSSKQEMIKFLATKPPAEKLLVAVKEWESKIRQQT